MRETILYLHGGKMRDNRLKLQQETFGLSVREMFSHDSHLLEDEPTQVVRPPGLEAFMTQMGKINRSTLSIHPAWGKRLD